MHDVSSAGGRVWCRWTRLTVKLLTLASVVTAGVVTSTGSVQAATVERWAGADRYATSVRISQEAFPTGANIVFLATGQSFPDALAAGPAAAMLDAPMLLTETSQFPAVVSAELQRLNPDVVYLLGGLSAVASSVETQVAAATSAEIRRLYGNDRYGTAAAVAEVAFPTAGVVYIADGATFADALSTGAPGSILQRPVLLTAKGSLPSATRAQITRLANPEVIVLGGTAAVSDAVVAELKALTTKPVRRVSGANRYATSAAASADAFYAAGTVFLSTGAEFADAISAPPAARRLSAAILLITPTCVPAEVVSELQRLGATRIIVLGGPGAVSDEAARLTPCPVVVPPNPVEVQQVKLNQLFGPFGTPPLVVDGVSGPVTRQRLCAARLALGLPASTAAMVAGSFEEGWLLGASRLGAPASTATLSPRWILIDKTCQMLFAGSGSGLTLILPTSTGSSGFETRPQDRTRAFRFDPAAGNGGWHNSSLYPVSADNPLNGNMYKPLYFDRGQAIHGSTNVPTSPQSKGCARLTVNHMNVLVDWLGLGGVRTPINSRDRLAVTVNVQGQYQG